MESKILNCLTLEPKFYSKHSNVQLASIFTFKLQDHIKQRTSLKFSRNNCVLQKANVKITPDTPETTGTYNHMQPAPIDN